MNVAARLIRLGLLALCSLPMAGCGGDEAVVFDPVQHDMEIILSNADLETRRKASRNLIGQSFTDEQIAQLMAIVKDDKQDRVIRIRIIEAFGTLGPERGNDLIGDLLEVANQSPSDKGLQETVTKVTNRLSWKN
jgi:hypothetical protein